MRSPLHIARFSRLVKFPHTIFALPFAVAMVAIVMRTHTVSVEQFIWIIVAMVTARSAAMAYNRIVDRDIDAINPRTANRELPRGEVSVGEAKMFLLVNIILYFLSCLMLGWHCVILSPVLLGVLLMYSWTKRFTAYSHFVLGLALALAPGGVWYALTGELSVTPLFLMLAVLLWVSGFDILYSCQDVEFDRAQALFSLPVRVGVSEALQLARVFHAASVVLLWWFGLIMQCGVLYFFAVALFGALLVYQHLLVGPQDLSRINAAFFHTNGIASLVYCLGVVLDSFS